VNSAVRRNFEKAGERENLAFQPFSLRFSDLPQLSVQSSVAALQHVLIEWVRASEILKPLRLGESWRDD
jgi:hypothetical protein